MSRISNTKWHFLFLQAQTSNIHIWIFPLKADQLAMSDLTTSQWTPDTKIMSLWRQNDVTTSFWHHNDVIFALYAHLDDVQTMKHLYIYRENFMRCRRDNQKRMINFSGYCFSIYLVFNISDRKTTLRTHDYVYIFHYFAWEFGKKSTNVGFIMKC